MNRRSVSIALRRATLNTPLKTALADEQADKLTNPDVTRANVDDDGWAWDRRFQLPGLLDVASRPEETPADLS